MYSREACPNWSSSRSATEYSASLYDLLTAYAIQRQKRAVNNVRIAKRGVWSLKDARDILTRLIGTFKDWTALDSFLIDYLTTPEEKATAIASSFAATLEMVREGTMEMRQERAFAPLYLRGRQALGERIMSETAKVIPFSGEGSDKLNPAERLHLAEAVRMAEAIIFASAEPVSDAQLAQRLPDGLSIPMVMEELREIYSRRGVNLVRVGAAWAFRTAPDLAFMMTRDTVQQKKLSRAALEVLAIIAYHQPVTRAEIEDIRGVETSKGTLDTLLETEWVRMRGRRKTPGRPVTYGTTDGFPRSFRAGGNPRPAGH